MSDWSDLSEQLKKLGVRLGKDTEFSKPARKKIPIESLVSGHEFETIFGSVFSSNHNYAEDHIHGTVPLKPISRFDVLAQWAQAAELADSSISDFIFLDTETTGLSGGTGTIPFMIGAARFIQDQFVVEQFFLRNPSEEKAQLAALTKFVDGGQAIVSYNGKSFDLPIINTRYILNRLGNPFDEMAHFDLLHISRRVWKRRLKQCNLGNIEKEILQFQRSGEDAPGYLVPEFYRDYLLNGDGSQIAKVFYHNEIDVVSLSALFTSLAAILEDPSPNNLAHAADIYSLGKLMESLNKEEVAANLYAADGLLETEGDELLLSLLSRAKIFKRHKNYEQALPLWQESHELGSPEASLELAIYYEHLAKNLPKALFYTDSLIKQAERQPSPNKIAIEQITHRRKRILRKMKLTE